MKRLIWVLAFASSPFWVGCGGSGSGSATAPAGKPTSTASEKTPASITPSAEIVAQFLDSVRRGDEVTAGKFFTTAAVEEIQKSGYEFAPPGTPDATFSIGRTEYTDDEKDTAYVQVIWIEPDPNGGKSEETEAVFVMRLETAGWRIASLVVDEKQIVKGPDGKDVEESVPVVLDFESLTSQAQMAQLQANPQQANPQQAPNQNNAGNVGPNGPAPQSLPLPANQLGSLPAQPQSNANGVAQRPTQLPPPNQPQVNAPQNQLRASTNNQGGQPTQTAQPPAGSNSIKR